MFHQGCGGSVGVAFVFTLSACAGTRCAIGDWARDNTCQWEREQPSETEIKGEKEGRELAEASEWKIHTVAGPKSPSVFARSPQLQTAGQGWLCCANEMVGTQTHSHTTHTHETQERIVSDAVLSRNHKWAEQESAARHHPSATTGCSGQHPHDSPPPEKTFCSGNQPTFFLTLRVKWDATSEFCLLQQFVRVEVELYVVFTSAFWISTALEKKNVGNKKPNAN